DVIVLLILYRLDPLNGGGMGGAMKNIASDHVIVYTQETAAGNGQAFGDRASPLSGICGGAYRPFGDPEPGRAGTVQKIKRFGKAGRMRCRRSVKAPRRAGVFVQAGLQVFSGAARVGEHL